MKGIFIALLFLLAAAAAPAQVRFHTGSLDAVRSEAVQKGKLVFIDIYTTWCGPCKQMDRDVFSRRDVGDFMDEQFVCARYDGEQETGAALAQRYGVDAVPTFLIFNIEGELLGRTSGARTAGEFLRDMRTLLDKLRERGDLAPGDRTMNSE